MDNLTAIATEHGLSLLSSEFKNQAKKFQLIGHTELNKTEADLTVFHSADIETSYFDNNKVLTFVIQIPVDSDFQKYVYKINIIDTSDKVVANIQTPKIFLAKGIAGTLTIKAAVTGNAGEIVFKKDDYITTPEMNDIWLSKVYTKTEVDTHINDALNQIGLIKFELITAPRTNQIAGLGGEFNRADYPKLWTFIQTQPTLLKTETEWQAEATANFDSATNMSPVGFYSSGNGSTTFRVPNLYGIHTRAGNAINRLIGSYEADAIRNIVGSIVKSRGAWGVGGGFTGAFSHISTHSGGAPAYGSGDEYTYDFDASRVVPTADDNRPKNIAFLPVIVAK